MKHRSLKTIRRDNLIHEEYNALILRGGDFAKAVSRKFIYDAIAQRTGYSTRTIADVLNPQLAKEKERDNEIAQLKTEVSSIKGSIDEMVALIKAQNSGSKKKE